MKLRIWLSFMAFTSSVSSFAIETTAFKPLGADMAPNLKNQYVVSFPAHCNELLPDDPDFTDFLRKAARIMAVRKAQETVPLLKILAYRDELQIEVNWSQLDQNPGDTILRGYLCHYFKEEAQRMTLTSSSIEISGFVQSQGNLIVERLKSEIAYLRTQRIESEKLSAEIAKSSKDFQNMRADVKAQVREALQKDLK